VLTLKPGRVPIFWRMVNQAAEGYLAATAKCLIKQFIPVRRTSDCTITQLFGGASRFLPAPAAQPADPRALPGQLPS
jgi:hypothetical protein